MQYFDWYELVWLVVSIIASGVYSGSEAVVLSLSIDRTRQLIEEGGKKAQALTFLTENAQSILTTILIGNNVVNIFSASMATRISTRYFKNDGLGVTVGIMTLVILIFGEIIPKTFARSRAERLLPIIIRLLKYNYVILYPLVESFNWIIRKVLGKDAEWTGRITTKDDIEYMVGKAEKEQSIDSKQIDLLNSILEFPTIKVKDIMIPRGRVQSLKADSTFYEVVSSTRSKHHSRYPVCEDGNLDDTLGFLHVKDLVFLSSQDKKNFDLKNYLKSPFFIYEHMKINVVFDHMNRKKVHLGMVKDENGLVVGIITLEDIMEEIFGEIQDEHDKEKVTQETQAQSSVVVEGHISLRDLHSEYNVHIPLNDNYSTLTGFILDILGNSFPRKGNIIFWKGMSFRLEEVINQEIKKVRITDVEGEKHIYSRKKARSPEEERKSS